MKMQGNSKTSVSIKAVNAKNTEIRRFHASSFMELVEKIERLFELSTENTQLLYLDCEDDWCVFAEENEWKEAVRQMNETRVLKIRICEKSPSEPVKTQVPEQWRKYVPSRDHEIGKRGRRLGRRGRGRGRGRRKWGMHHHREGNPIGVEEKIAFLKEKKAQVETNLSAQVKNLEMELARLDSQKEETVDMPVWKQKKIQGHTVKMQNKLQCLKQRLERRSACLASKIEKKEAQMKKKDKSVEEKKEFKKKVKILVEKMGIEKKEAKRLLRECGESVDLVHQHYFHW